MAAIQGDKVLFQIEDPTSSGTYVTLAMEASLTYALSLEDDDITNKGSGGYRQRLPTIRDSNLDVSAIFDSGSTVLKFIRDMWVTRAQRNVRVLFPTERWDGIYKLSDFSIEASSDTAAKVSFTMDQSGVVSVTEF